MAVQEQTPIIEYIANGSTNIFPITFDIHSTEDLGVLINGELALEASYQVQDNSVVFMVIPPSGSAVTLFRDTEKNRLTDYKSYDNSFRPSAINWDLDKLWHVLQEQNLVDAKILARLKTEIEWRRAHDFNYDELAQIREKQIFDSLLGYTNTLFTSTTPNVFEGVTAGVVFALDKKSVQTHLNEIAANLEEIRLNLQNTEENSIQAIASEESRAIGAEENLNSKITNESSRAQAAELVLQNQVNAVGVGNKAYLTYALMDADKVNIPAKSKVTVTNDTTASNNGDWQWDGVAFTKSAYDPLKQGKEYTDDQIFDLADTLRQNDSRFFTNLDILTAALINSSTGDVVANENWRSSALIPVKKYDKVTINAQSNSTVNANIAFYNETEGFISSGICSTDTTYQSKTFVAERDGYVRFATRLPAAQFSASISSVEKTLSEAEIEALIKLSAESTSSYLESEYETGYIYTVGGNRVSTSDTSHRAYLIPVVAGEVIEYEGTLGSDQAGQVMLYMAQLDENKNYVSDVTTYTSTGGYVIGKLRGTAVQDGFMYVRARVLSNTYYLNKLDVLDNVQTLKRRIDNSSVDIAQLRTDVDLLNTSFNTRVSDLVDTSIDSKVSTAVADQFEEIAESTVETLVNDAIASSDLTSLTLVDPLIEKLPVRLSMDHGYNSQTYSQNNIVKAGGFIYIVGVDENRSPFILKRSEMGGPWSVFDLSTIVDNPFIAPNAEDSHNNFVVGVTKDGYLIVTGNHHGHSCRAAISNNPHDITAWTAITYTSGTVTYPRLINHPDGTLMAFWREGGSGNGSYWMSTFNDSTKSFNAKKQLIAPAENPPSSSEAGTNGYEQTVAVDATGTIHLCWGYRTLSSSAVANFGMFYAKSVDKGETWTNAVGTVNYAKPLTDLKSERIYTVNVDEGYVNQNGGCYDLNNRYHTVLWHKHPTTGNSRIVHVWFNGTSWQSEVVYTLDRPYPPTSNMLPGYFSRPHIICGQSGKLFVVYKNTYINTNQIRAIDVTTPGAPKDFGLLNFGTRQTELALNIEFPIKDNELVMMLAKGGGNVTNTIWQNQSAYLVTAPLPV